MLLPSSPGRQEASKLFSDGADDLNTCCRSTMPSRKKGAKRYWGGSCQGSLVHRTQRRAACVMERSRRTRVRMHQRRRVIGSLSCERTVVPGALRWPAGRQESTADGRRLSNRVDGGFSCGRAAVILLSCTAGNQGGNVRLVILSSFFLHLL